MIKLHNRYFPALLIAGGFLLNSCSKPDDLGIEVQPVGDVPGVYFTDTLTVIAETIKEDSLRSDEAVAALKEALAINPHLQAVKDEIKILETQEPHV